MFDCNLQATFRRDYMNISEVVACKIPDESFNFENAN